MTTIHPLSRSFGCVHMNRLAATAFLVVVSFVLAGCDNSSSEAGGKGPAEGGESQVQRQKRSILRVLKADAEIGKKLKSRIGSNTKPSNIASAIGVACRQMENIKLSECPADFRIAYRQHSRAWRAYQVAVQQLPDDFLEGVFVGFLNGLLRGEADGGAGRLERGLNRAQERVRITWEDVENIGAKYGAAL